MIILSIDVCVHTLFPQSAVNSVNLLSVSKAEKWYQCIMCTKEKSHMMNWCELLGSLLGTDVIRLWSIVPRLTQFPWLILPLRPIRGRNTWLMSFMVVNYFVFYIPSHKAKTARLASIRHRFDRNLSDWCLFYVDPENVCCFGIYGTWFQMLEWLKHIIAWHTTR